jgi:TrmH family RNA methyltransferase
MLHFDNIGNFYKSKIKFIKSLRLKKYRLQENSFILEGAKNVELLLASNYEVNIVVATANFLDEYTHLLLNRNIEIFKVDQKVLSSLGTFQENNAALAVATIPANEPFTIHSHQYVLILDGISDPGNLGTIIRVADWYAMAGIICSNNTVELYNPKVLHASMGSFINTKVYYTDLTSYLAQTRLPIMGAFTKGESIHTPQIVWPSEGLIIIGNEANGISEKLMPYIHRKISIPNYGRAESLNAALATAIICDNLTRLKVNLE